eukprot:scaffold277083_cov28-Tisochrysis_lutea.AAC.1
MHTPARELRAESTVHNRARDPLRRLRERVGVLVCELSSRGREPAVRQPPRHSSVVKGSHALLVTRGRLGGRGAPE